MMLLRGVPFLFLLTSLFLILVSFPVGLHGIVIGHKNDLIL